MRCSNCWTAIILALAVGCLAGGAVAEEPILIGTPLPLTGPYASDGEQMKMALELAVAEKNAAGGLLGRKLELKFGDVGGLEAEKIKAVGERLIGAGVDVVITGYDDGGVDTKVFGQYDVPYLHGNAMTLCTEPVAQNFEKYWNCFQYTYNDKDYGVDAAVHLFEVPPQIGWKPPNKKIAVIKVDYAYNVMPADEFARRVEKQGYEVVINETTQFGVAEWGPILSRIESTQPAFVTFWNLDPTDAARFIKQFSDRFGDEGIDALVYMQYTPSIPEFLELAGKAAEGLIWVGSAGNSGPKFEDYKKRWVAQFKKDPAGLYAVATRDAFDIWAQAVERAGCVDCYREVARHMREATYEGMAATYVFNPLDQSALLGEYLMPLVWYQIWEGKSVPMGPKRFKQTNYRKPPWIKK
ncbi:MAG: ABC transporter substrate-binding protein [Desulfobacterales bacterium]|nr:MAG: ABC transporter substrate-binding protein [Desulfobacterales bacterium]